MVGTQTEGWTWDHEPTVVHTEIVMDFEILLGEGNIYSFPPLLIGAALSWCTDVLNGVSPGLVSPDASFQNLKTRIVLFDWLWTHELTVDCCLSSTYSITPLWNRKGKNASFIIQFLHTHFLRDMTYGKEMSTYILLFKWNLMCGKSVAERSI